VYGEKQFINISPGGQTQETLFSLSSFFFSVFYFPFSYPSPGRVKIKSTWIASKNEANSKKEKLSSLLNRLLSLFCWAAPTLEAKVETNLSEWYIP